MKKERARKIKLEKDYNPMKPFEQQDTKEERKIQYVGTYDKRYVNIMNDWKDNLTRKHKARARSLELLKNYVIYYYTVISYLSYYRIFLNKTSKNSSFTISKKKLQFQLKTIIYSLL